MTRRGSLNVAIVGMACRFPGAPDLVAFWENMLAGKSAISDVPTGRWDPQVFCDPSSTANDRVAGRRGGYLDFPIPIDPAAHGVLPHAIDGGEPEQYLVLEAAKDALADAGLPEGVADGRRVDVIVGRGNYFNRGNLTRLQHGRIAEQTLNIVRALRPDLSEADLTALRRDLKAGLPPFNAATIPGQLTNATAGRVANRLNLRGSSFVVDAASASAMVALDIGARAVSQGGADLAIIGGVYVQSDVDFPLVFSRLGALSKTGRSCPFGRSADGMVPGEGVGVVILKRLADAERDGDRVYAILCGVGIASDGRGLGLGTPSVRGHALAMRRAYRRSGLDPSTIGLIEGHGLGVPSADRAELRAIEAVFPPSRDRAIGAISSMIGHAMPASGIAGVIKAALALHHRALPPTLGADSPHPLLVGEGRRASPNRTTRPWVHGDSTSPRRAAVNSFGFAGINGHAVLEEHPASTHRAGCSLTWDSEAILLGSPDRLALGRSLGTLADQIERRGDASLKDLAATLNASIAPGPARLGLVVQTTAELVERLRALSPRLMAPDCPAIRDGRGIYFREEPSQPPALAVIFPGEGSQYPGMLRDLAIHFPEVRALLDTSDRLARESGAAELPSRLLYGDIASEGQGLWAIGPAVNVVLSAQWALYGLLVELGIRPDAVIGHSSGEFLAMAAGGALQVDRRFEDALGRLGALFERMETSGEIPEASLLAVAAGRDRLDALTAGWPIAVAMDNCPHQVVLASDRDTIARFEPVLREAGLLSEPLPFARAYHTSDFAQAIGPVRQLLDGMDVSPPAIPIYSCASAGPMPSDPTRLRDLAADQWSRTVRFREAILRMHADGFRTFIDVGPRGHLAGFVEDTLRGRDAHALAIGVPRRSGVMQLNHLVAMLFNLGYAPKTEILYRRRNPVTIDLNADPPVLKPLPQLRLGFPEMRVSDEVANRLRLPEGRPLSTPEQHMVNQERANVPPADLDDDPVMLDFLHTMDQFLETQREVMAGYLRPLDSASPTSERPGPWAGEVVTLVEGREVVTRYVLDAVGDPLAKHHTLGGRRVSAVDPDRLGLPVLPFAVMAEMLAQVAAILAPGDVLVSLLDVQAHRWIRYEDTPVSLEIEARRVENRPEQIHVAIFNRGPAHAMKPRESPVVEGVAVFGRERPAATEARRFAQANPGACRFTAEQLYREQWLFHGPALQAVTRVGEVSNTGIEGELRVRPLGPLLRDPSEAVRLHSDPVILDNFTHLLGCWGLDRLDGGDVVFPLRMGELALFGESPSVGEALSCRIKVNEVEHHRIRAEAEIVRADGTTWMRILAWEDWRFRWPSRYRDVFRQPDVELLAEPMPLDDAPSSAVAVWLEPPLDMGRPVWRDVLEQTQLSPGERAEIARGPDARRALRLWGRIAAKDAARRLGLDRGDGPIFPADLEIRPDPHGRPVLQSLLKPSRDDLPSISIAHTEGVAVAIATLDPQSRPGIDVEKVKPQTAGFESIAFSPSERRLIDLMARDGHRDEWVARFWCSKEAVAKATGRGMSSGPRSVEVVGIGSGAKELLVALGANLDAAVPGPHGEPIRVRVSQKGEYVWAWTLAERSVAQ